MSWNVILERADGTPVTVPRHAEGGTYVVDGTDRAALNVTYNYSGHIAKALGFHFTRLSGMKAADALPILEWAVATLGTVRDGDYWEATPGNVGFALNILLGWARLHPDATFRVL